VDTSLDLYADRTAGSTPYWFLPAAHWSLASYNAFIFGLYHQKVLKSIMHPSRIFTGLLVIFLLSVYLSTSTNYYFLTSLFFVPLCLFLSILFWKQKRLRLIFLFAFVIILGFYRGGTTRQETRKLNFGETTFTATVTDEPKISGKSQIILVSPKELSSQIQIRTTQFPSYHYGNELYISGHLYDPLTESPEYQTLFRVRNINGAINFPEISILKASDNNLFTKIRTTLIGVRLRYEEVISKMLPEPQGGLLAGIMLGTRSEIPTEIMNNLSRSGLIHIIALSGFNITIVASFLSKLSNRISRLWSFWIPVLGIISFVLATGFSASIVRAAIMGILLLLANVTGRQSSALISILFASAVMVFINPLILTLDVGFQLSFAATVGLLLFSPKIEGFFQFLGPEASKIISTSLATVIFTWPITSYYFGVVSIISPLANLLILPFIPYIMAFGFTAATIGLISIWLAGKFSLIVWLMINLLIKIAETLSGFSFAAFNFKIKSINLIVAYYIFTIDILLMLKGNRIATKAEEI
jgi:competence protein ComEC